MPKITKTYVEGLPYTTTGQKYYPCSEIKGFGIIVGQKSKTFCAQRDIAGRTVRVSIGKFSVFTVEQAKQEAQDHLRSMAKGINPNKLKKLAKQRTTTLKEAIEDYKEARKDLSAATLYRLKALQELYFPDWLDKELRAIDKEMIFKRHLKLGQERGKTTANKMMQAVRAVYNFARTRDESLPENPVSALSSSRAWYKETKRRNIIKSHQIKKWYDTVTLLDNSVIRDYLRMLLFTGMRREEGLTLAWENVDFKGKTILIPDTKNGQPLELPMSDFIFNLLKEREARKEKGDKYVFPSKTSKTGHLIEPRKTIKAIELKCGVEFMLHDLRRTFITIAESLDVPAYALKGLVNHSTGGDITAGYIQITTDRLREPMQRITNKIVELVTKEEAKTEETAGSNDNNKAA